MEIGIVGYNRPITLLGLGFAELNPNLCTRQTGWYRVKKLVSVWTDFRSQIRMFTVLLIV